MSKLQSSLEACGVSCTRAAQVGESRLGNSQVTEKFEFYDLLGILVPGTLLVYVSLLCFPQIVRPVPVKFPDAVNTIIFTVLIIFVGQLVQALASLIEPLLYWTWGGRPSDRALGSGLGRYMPADTGDRIRRKLQRALGEEATTNSLFLYAMQRAEAAGSGRVAKFNGLYAYHRALILLVLSSLLLVMLSAYFGALSLASRWEVAGICIALALVLILVWHRARQRAMYYVREVLLTAERLLDTAS